MSVLAVFPLFLVRRACKYSDAVISYSIKHPVCSHAVKLEHGAHVYVTHATSGKTVRGI